MWSMLTLMEQGKTFQDKQTTSNTMLDLVNSGEGVTGFIAGAMEGPVPL